MALHIHIHDSASQKAFVKDTTKSFEEVMADPAGRRLIDAIEDTVSSLRGKKGDTILEGVLRSQKAELKRKFGYTYRDAKANDALSSAQAERELKNHNRLIEAIKKNGKPVPAEMLRVQKFLENELAEVKQKEAEGKSKDSAQIKSETYTSQFQKEAGIKKEQKDGWVKSSEAKNPEGTFVVKYSKDTKDAITPIEATHEAEAATRKAIVEGSFDNHYMAYMKNEAASKRWAAAGDQVKARKYHQQAQFHANKSSTQSQKDGYEDPYLGPEGKAARAAMVKKLTPQIGKIIKVTGYEKFSSGGGKLVVTGIKAGDGGVFVFFDFIDVDGKKTGSSMRPFQEVSGLNK